VVGAIAAVLLLLRHSALRSKANTPQAGPSSSGVARFAARYDRPARSSRMRFRLKTSFLTYAHDQIRGGLWYKPTWWEAVQKVPPTAVLPRLKKKFIPRLRFIEDKLMRLVSAASQVCGDAVTHTKSNNTLLHAPSRHLVDAGSSRPVTPR